MEYIRVPSLAENVEAVTIGKWLVEPGQVIAEGDEVVGLLTEKADFNYESPYAGTVSALLYPERSTVAVGAVLCVIDGADSDVERAHAENAGLVASAQSAAGLVPLSTDEHPRIQATSAVEKVRATPAARRLAKEHNIDLAVIAAECGGTVREEHVKAYLDR